MVIEPAMLPDSGLKHSGEAFVLITEQIGLKSVITMFSLV